MIRLSKSSIGETEKQAVMGVLDREFLGMGEEVQQFEEELTRFFGRSTACVVNGTAALQLALQAIGIGDSDEVLVQSLTYVASFQAISAIGATPVAFGPQKRPNVRKERIFGVISPVWFPQGSKSVEY